MRTVKAMSVEDALKLVRGGASSVTEFFAAKTRSPLSEEFLPIVTQTTGRLSLARNYNELADRAASPGLLKPDEAQVETYVTRRALEGLFWMVGEEERKIRANPFKTGSAILRHVFGV